MSNDSLILRSNPLVKALNKSLQVGSLDDLVRVHTDTNIFLLLDCSGSMGYRMRSGKTRITGLRDTVRDVQSEKEMKMVQFGSPEEEATFVTTIPEPCGGTPLHKAINFAKNNGAGRAIVISDGCPDDQSAAMAAAAAFGGRIDCVFVGDPGERGEAFLKSLAQSTGGEMFTGDLSEPLKLAAAVLGLLTDGKDDEDDEA